MKRKVIKRITILLIAATMVLVVTTLVNKLDRYQLDVTVTDVIQEGNNLTYYAVNDIQTRHVLLDANGYNIGDSLTVQLDSKGTDTIEDDEIIKVIKN